MPFVNHDSDKTKYRDKIFFQKISEKKQNLQKNSEKLGWHLAKNPT
jgi:hypothetical protein